MTEIKPATDADIQGAEKMAEGGWSSVEDTLALIARIRQEQRRAEAAERVAEAAIVFRERGTVLTCCNRGPCQQVRELPDKSDPQAILYRMLRAYDTAKAAGFPKEG